VLRAQVPSAGALQTVQQQATAERSRSRHLDTFLLLYQELQPIITMSTRQRQVRDPQPALPRRTKGIHLLMQMCSKPLRHTRLVQRCLHDAGLVSQYQHMATSPAIQAKGSRGPALTHCRIPATQVRSMKYPLNHKLHPILLTIKAALAILNR